MSDQNTQNLQTHIRHDKMLYVYLLILLVSLILACLGLMWGAKWIASAVILNTIATILLSANARGYGTKVQDRVIRLEMRLRLEGLLPDDLKSRVSDFQLGQLMSMRFASDEELPELARKVLDENITNRGEIKKLVKDWQADFLRV